MRKDMSKVLVERSRIPGRASKGRLTQKNKEDSPNKQSMKKNHLDRKQLNENLSPLKRFLHSKIGQHWDKVFSEISENLKTTSTVQQHVRDHVFDFVHKNVVIGDDKKLMVMGKWSGTFRELSNNSLYICPKTGILKKHKIEKVKAKPFDKFNREINYLSSEKSQLYFEDGTLYKVFKNKDTDEWSIFEHANVTHARSDFSQRYTWMHKQSILRFFHEFADKIDFKHPYFATYVDLINKNTEETKKKDKESPLKVGALVEFSHDSGKTWSEGIINRVEAADLSNTRSYFITVGTKNIKISGYVPRDQIRIKA